MKHEAEKSQGEVCGISGGEHFFFKMTSAVRREGKPDRRVKICEWCYKPKLALKRGEAVVK